MLWLPWSALGALQLLRAPPSDATESEFDALTVAVRAIVSNLAKQKDMSVDNYRYDPAEVLLAMAAALRMHEDHDLR